MLNQISCRHALAAGLLLSFAQTAAAQEVVDYIVALVNDDVVLSSEVDETFESVSRQIRSRGAQLPSEDALKRQILERIIMTRVQVQRALQGGMRVTDVEMNQAMTEIAARNNLSLNQFAQALRSEGIDYLALRKQIRDEMLVDELRRREVDSRIVVSSEDIALFLEKRGLQDNDSEFRLAHILLAVPEGGSEGEQQRKQLEALEIVNQARNGTEFGQLAIVHSNSPRALEGGDLGWRRGGELPSLFADLVPRMEVGEVSDPIATSGGIHIIKLVEKRGGDEVATVAETRARHILLKANVLRDEDATRKQIVALRQQILDGADFAELARKNSEDPGSVNQGGDLGWQGPESFVPEFQDALSKLKPGKVSEPFRSPFGWHIAEVLERRERDRTEELRRAQARAAIFKRKAGEEFEIWVRRLRDEAYVEYREPPSTS